MFGFGKKVDTDALGEELAPALENSDNVNSTLVAIEEAARKAGFTSRQAEDIQGAAFREYLERTGKAHLYPEIFED